MRGAHGAETPPKRVSTNVPSADDLKSYLLNVWARRFVWDAARLAKLLGDQFFRGVLGTAVAPAICRVGPGISVGMRGVRDVPLFIGANDLLNQIVTHHVLLAELNGADAIDFPADFQRLHEARLFPSGQVDLR